MTKLRLRPLTLLLPLAAGCAVDSAADSPDVDGYGTGGDGSYGSGGAYGVGGAVASGGSWFTGGGPSAGGAEASGGAGSGGFPASGGAGTGGLGTGGSSSGGAGTGGAGTGGAGTGGAGTGGAGTGGASSVQKFVGNITTENQIDYAGKTFSTYWDQITPENAGKWGSVQSSASGGFNWGTLDAIYDYAEDHDIVFKQHTFVWGSQQPSGTPSEQQVKTWIQNFCSRYPNTKLIDVVNEPPPHTEPNYAGNIGGGTNGNWAWITNSFKWARQYCPNAILILNDYNNIEWSNDNSHFISIVKTALSNGAPIDAVGAQAHDLDHASVSTNTMKTLLQKLHDETKLPVYITEYDISSTNDTTQLDKYKEQIPYFLSTSWIHGVTIWGWVRGKTWSQAPDSGLMSQSGTPRPAFTWLMQQLGRPAP